LQRLHRAAAHEVTRVVAGASAPADGSRHELLADPVSPGARGDAELLQELLNGVRPVPHDEDDLGRRAKCGKTCRISGFLSAGIMTNARVLGSPAGSFDRLSRI